MLKNKWFIATVAVLLTAAVAYDVWYFMLREEDGGNGGVVGRAARVAEQPGPAAGEPGSGDAPADSAAPPAETSLITLAADRRPALRDSSELAAVGGAVGRAGWGREPLARSGALAGSPSDARETPRQPVTPPGWVLSAVMAGGDRRAAVVDGRVVREGEEVRGGGTVIEIRRNSVVIRWRGRREVVRLRRPD